MSQIARSGIRREDGVDITFLFELLFCNEFSAAVQQDASVGMIERVELDDFAGFTVEVKIFVRH